MFFVSFKTLTSFSRKSYASKGISLQISRTGTLQILQSHFLPCDPFQCVFCKDLDLLVKNSETTLT